MNAESTWAPRSDSRPPLRAGEVDVWRVALEQAPDVLAKFWETLAADEIERANRFHFEEHRSGFVVARGFLRAVICRYLDATPHSLKFAYGEFGKPWLEGRLRFNLSHSGALALLAVTEDNAIGVDVERIRPDFTSEEIARRFFSTSEVEVFNALPGEERVAAFFRCWTRKEAFIKATGRGLSQSLDAFDVTLAAGVPAALLRVEGDEASRWSICDLEVGTDYAAAVVVEGPPSSIRCWEFC
jgi:4'-phosphopantetheinyl transferase